MFFIGLSWLICFLLFSETNRVTLKLLLCWTPERDCVSPDRSSGLCHSLLYLPHFWNLVTNILPFFFFFCFVFILCFVSAHRFFLSTIKFSYKLNFEMTWPLLQCRHSCCTHCLLIPTVSYQMTAFFFFFFPNICPLVAESEVVDSATPSLTEAVSFFRSVLYIVFLINLWKHWQQHEKQQDLCGIREEPWKLLQPQENTSK